LGLDEEKEEESYSSGIAPANLKKRVAARNVKNYAELYDDYSDDEFNLQ